jgi:hypothetical protein
MVADPVWSREKLGPMPVADRQLIHSYPKVHLLALSLSLFSCTLFLATACKGPHHQGVKYRKGKPLTYIEDQFGNRIPDYSTAGYASGKPIPEVSIVKTLSPQTNREDDTARIQAAIDQLSSASANANGLRGALLLEAGDYYVSGTIHIRQSGVVLRGEGQFDGGTVIHATGTVQRSLIFISGEDPEHDAMTKNQNPEFHYQNESSSTWEVIDEHVPSGKRLVQVSPVRGLAAGDTVILEQRMNQAWVETLGMNDFPDRPDGKASPPWDPADFRFQFERTIETIDGGRIHFKEPLVNPVFARFGSSILFKPILPKRVEKVGLENLRLISEYQPTDNHSDEAHAWNGIEFQRAKDSWVRGVTAVHFGNTTVTAGRQSLQLTIEDCGFLKPIARYGYGRRHGFFNAGQQILIQRCYAEDSSFPFFVPGKTAGPNVFLDCYASGDRVIIGPWRYWAMGTLWDNVHGDKFMIRNRGYEGDNWGWSGINQLFWSCTAFDWISVQSPINGWNWAIGNKGDRVGGAFQGLTGHISDHEKRVNPRSLYMKQLEDRIGVNAASPVFSENQFNGAVLFHVKDTLSEK